MDHWMPLQGPSSFRLGAKLLSSRLCQSLSGTRRGNLIFSGAAMGLPAASTLQNSGSEPGTVLLSGHLAVRGNAAVLVGGDQGSC